ncbi:MAG: choice-of-anchor D domain-containing protein [Myxococcales bacterium]
MLIHRSPWMAKWVGVGLALMAAIGCPDSKTSGVSSRISVDVASVDFGKVRPGGTLQQTLEVRCASTVSLEFVSVTLDGAGKGAFSVANAPTKLDSGEDATLQLTFAPQADGNYQATLVLATNDPDSPAKVTLKGRGASPKLRVVPECRTPCSAFSATESPAAIAFGARRPLKHGSDGKVIDEPSWPTVTLLNEGELPVTVQTLAIKGSADFATVEPINVPSFPIGPGAGQALHVRFDPTSGAATSEASLEVDSDDPASPKLSVALTGSLAPAPDLQVCAAIVESQGPDGSISTPRNAQGDEDFAGAQPPVQPGKNALVTFSAFSDHFLATKDPAKCTGSPETGRDGLKLSWTLEERPAESSATLQKATTATPTLAPDAIGHYKVRLTATDANGKTGSAVVEFDAYPRRDLVAQPPWKEAGVDLDLHLVRPGSSCAASSCVFDSKGDLNGFSVRSGGSFDWGETGPGDDPRLDRDDQGTLGGVETVSLDRPQNDPACKASGTCVYGLYVHYFADARATSGSAPACSGAGCFEGDLCNCAAGTGCVAQRCVTPAHPVVAVYLKPTATSLPTVLPLPGEDFGIAGACWLWHLADVEWKSDGTAKVVPAGVSGAREMAYYGKMTPGSFACSPNTDPGLPAGYEVGTVPEYP